MRRLGATLCVIVWAAQYALCQDNPVVRSRPLVRQAFEAYHAGDYARAAARFDSALALRPDHPTLMYNLAAALCLSGNTHRALALLDRAASTGVRFSPRQDSSFTALYHLGAFSEIERAFERNSLRRGESSIAFSLEEKGLITEGIAYNPVDRSMYVGSVRTRTVFRRDTTGRITPFISRRDGLPGVFGMGVDPVRQVLWACVAGVPQVEGIHSGELGTTGVIKVDLHSGRILARLMLADTLRPHLLGDLTVGKDGTVYVTDSESPLIYRVNPGRDTLEVFIESPEFTSLQGVAMSNDEQRLYVADYSRGLFLCDLRNRNARLLAAPRGTTLLSIDGLCTYRNSLVAVQNDILPHRVVRLGLDSAGRRILTVTVLDVNDPLFAEPTLGVVVGDDLYVNAASQWGAVNAHGEVLPENQMMPHHIIRIPLR